MDNVRRVPEHNLDCRYRFTCGTNECPEFIASAKPPCYVDKFERYQPVWYQRDWEDLNRITWREVFSLEESWIYILYIIIILAFIFMVMIFIKVMLKLDIINLLP